MAIPTRQQIQDQVDSFYDSPPEGVSLEDYISQWLDSLDIPETIIIASNEVNPRQQILDDLETYAQ